MLDILRKESRARQHQISRKTLHRLPQQPRAPLTTPPPQRLLHGHHLLACPGGGKSANPTKRRVTVHKTPRKHGYFQPNRPASSNLGGAIRFTFLPVSSGYLIWIITPGSFSQRLRAPKEPTVPFPGGKHPDFQRIPSSGRLENSKNLMFS